MSDATEIGPIDFVLLEFPEGAPVRPVADALDAVLGSGVVRLYDIAVVSKGADGAVSRVDLAASDLPLDGFGAFAGAQSGLFDEADLAEAGGALDAGTDALLVAYENSWAAPFVAAADAAGGRVVASERIPAQVLLDALDALEAAG